METEKYNIIYTCGCIHEIEQKANGMHEPTGNNTECELHKKKEGI